MTNDRVIDGKVDEQKNEGDDSRFKGIIDDKYILTDILLALVGEVHGFSKEKVMACLDIKEDNRHVECKQTELFVGHNKQLRLDSLFDVTISDDNKVSLYVNVEAQVRLRRTMNIAGRGTDYNQCPLLTV